MQTDSLTAAMRARVTRRAFLGGAAGAASAAILAACGGNPDVNTPTAAPVAATAGAGSTGASTAG
ncbi:MAG: twin-arginine translocation signal domain-containing protein, partial [Chloroflexota bacterium]|nr:twin-arginine translocation signal domain-containing protein [Chloroflexota bacterium]